jgi:hypothetical protein
VTRDTRTGELVRITRADLDESGEPLLSALDPIGLELGHGVLERLRIRADDPLSAEIDLEHVSVARRGSWDVRIRTRNRTTAERDAFRVESELEAFEGGRAVFARRWDERIPRHGS